MLYVLSAGLLEEKEGKGRNGLLAAFSFFLLKC